MADIKKVMMRAITDGKLMLFAQHTIEKLQLELKTGNIQLEKVVKRGAKMVEDAQKRVAEAKRLSVDLASEYKTIADFYRANLATIDLEVIELDAYEKKIKRIGPVLTDEQKGIVREWAKLKAGQTNQEISNIRDFLVYKGYKVADLVPANQDTATQSGTRTRKSANRRRPANQVVAQQ